jgi:hypothetical protein
MRSSGGHPIHPGSPSPTAGTLTRDHAVLRGDGQGVLAAEAAPAMRYVMLL